MSDNGFHDTLAYGRPVPPVAVALLLICGGLAITTVYFLDLSAMRAQLSLFLRVLCGGTFLASAVPKVVDPRAFGEIVHDYKLTPRPVSRWAGYVFPGLELTVGLFMLLGLHLSLMAKIGMLLLVTFTVAIVINLVRGHVHISCGCFGGALDQRLNWYMPIRNGLLLVGLGSLAFPGTDFGPIGPGHGTFGSGLPTPFSGMDGALITVLAMIGVMAIHLSGTVVNMLWLDEKG